MADALSPARLYARDALVAACGGAVALAGCLAAARWSADLRYLFAGLAAAEILPAVAVGMLVGASLPRVLAQTAAYFFVQASGALVAGWVLQSQWFADGALVFAVAALPMGFSSLALGAFFGSQYLAWFRDRE